MLGSLPYDRNCKINNLSFNLEEVYVVENAESPWMFVGFILHSLEYMNFYQFLQPMSHFLFIHSV